MPEPHSPAAPPPSSHDVAGALRALGAATLGESGARRMRNRVQAAWPGAMLAAPAFPVRCTPGDNLAIHVAVARAPLGTALAVDVGEERELGYWGEVLTAAAQHRGVAGLVIDGCVRDVAALAAHGFPVFATGRALPGATKRRPGTIGCPVLVGGVEIDPGDWLVGDTDGVAVVPRESLTTVLAAARARAARERELFVALRSGRTTLELLALDASLVDDAREDPPGS